MNGRTLLQHEPAIATQQIQQRLDAAADLAAAALLRHTADLASQLTAFAAASPADLPAVARHSTPSVSVSEWHNPDSTRRP